MKTNLRATLLVWLLALLPAVVRGEDFFDVRTFNYQRQEGGVTLQAEIDFPTAGTAGSVREVRRWICELLGVDEGVDVTEVNFGKILQQACDGMFGDMESGRHSLQVKWTFEDPEIVTFESAVIDDDGERWTSEDVVSVSKKDGHRIQAGEIFKCGEEQIKQLMWDSRGKLQMEVGKASDLYVGDAGFIDGWIVVIGPAARHTGAAYRIRYATAVPYLRGGNRGGDYYE